MAGPGAEVFIVETQSGVWPAARCWSEAVWRKEFLIYCIVRWVVRSHSPLSLAGARRVCKDPAPCSRLLVHRRSPGVSSAASGASLAWLRASVAASAWSPLSPALWWGQGDVPPFLMNPRASPPGAWSPLSPALWWGQGEVPPFLMNPRASPPGAWSPLSPALREGQGQGDVPPFLLNPEHLHLVPDHLWALLCGRRGPSFPHEPRTSPPGRHTRTWAASADRTRPQSQEQEGQPSIFFDFGSAFFWELYSKTFSRPFLLCDSHSRCSLCFSFR